MNSDDYFAGLFDGEGWISLQRRTRASGVSFTLTVGVKMTNQDAVLALHERYGGSVSCEKRAHPRHRDCFTWRVCSTTALLFLESVEPALIVKREHARVGIKAGRYLSDHAAPGRKMTTETAQLRSAILTEFDALPKRGKEATSP